MESEDRAANLEKAKQLMLDCVKENGYVIEPAWREQGEHFRNFKAKPDDVWIITLPRSGTTLTQELVYLVMNDFDCESAKKLPFFVKVPSLHTSLCPHLWQNAQILVPKRDNPTEREMVPVDTTKSSAEIYADLPSPRIFKCHLAFSVVKSVLESGAKTIYVARNPKDRLVSWWKLLPPMSAVPCDVDFATFWRYARNEQILYEPTWKHIKEGWAQRNNPNVLFLFYEEMRENLPEVVKRVADFLGKPYTDEQIEAAVRHLDIDYFRRHVLNFGDKIDDANLEAAVNVFVGRGKVGGYKDVITPEVEKEMDEWIEENLRGTDIVFPGINK